MKKPNIAVAIGTRFMAHVHQIKVANVDDNHKTKNADDRIGKQAIMATVNSIQVRNIQVGKVAGDVDVIFVNEGKQKNPTTGLTLGMHSTFVGRDEQYPGEVTEEDVVFSDYKTAVEIANATNIAERQRLRSIITDLEKQVAAIDRVIEVNIAAEAGYSTED